MCNRILITFFCFSLICAAGCRRKPATGSQGAQSSNQASPGFEPLGRDPNFEPRPPRPGPPPPDPRPCNTSANPSTSAVTFFDDWPPSSCCNFALSPTGRREGPNPWACNDRISGLDVPFGMSAEICEHEGPGLGKCRRFLPGRSFVGSDLNDKATTFLVDPKMIGNLDSNDYPPGFFISIGISGSIDNPRAGGSIGYDGTDLVYHDAIPLPNTCLNPHVITTSKRNDGSATSFVKDGILNVTMRVKPTPPFGSSSQIGIEIKCQ